MDALAHSGSSSWRPKANLLELHHSMSGPAKHILASQPSAPRACPVHSVGLIEVLTLIGFISKSYAPQALLQDSATQVALVAPAFSPGTYSACLACSCCQLSSPWSWGRSQPWVIVPVTRWGDGEAGGDLKAALESQARCKGRCRELPPGPHPVSPTVTPSVRVILCHEPAVVLAHQSHTALRFPVFTPCLGPAQDPRDVQPSPLLRLPRLRQLLRHSWFSAALAVLRRTARCSVGCPSTGIRLLFPG